MSLGCLALKNLQQKVLSQQWVAQIRHVNNAAQKQRWSSEFVRRFTTAANEEKKPEGKEISVSEGGKKSKLFPRRRRNRSLWRNGREFVPSLRDFFPSGLGNALMQATENVNRLFDSLPSQLIGRVKEQDECYKLRYEVPGLGKDDVKITVEDGILTIKGEHKEEEEQGSDDEFWSSQSYGFYNTSLMLPDDAKVDEIKAEMKDGVLCITIPRSEKAKKDVKEIQVH